MLSYLLYLLYNKRITREKSPPAERGKRKNGAKFLPKKWLKLKFGVMSNIKMRLNTKIGSDGSDI